jgi:hypothetical protein
VRGHQTVFNNEHKPTLQGDLLKAPEKYAILSKTNINFSGHLSQVSFLSRAYHTFDLLTFFLLLDITIKQIQKPG